jgi:thiol-disulfide isomerase/thioredoxin
MRKSAKKAAIEENSNFLRKIFGGAVGVILVPAILLVVHRYVRKESAKSDLQTLQSALETLQSVVQSSDSAERSESAVIALSGSVVDFATKHPEGALVEFYMPDCDHCKKLKPDYEAAAKELAALGGPPLASLDGEAYPEIAKEHGVSRYPTVLWFRGGESVQELKPTSRTKAKILEFVNWVQEPAFTEFETMAEFDEGVPQIRLALQDKSPPVIVGFASSESNSVQQALQYVGERLRGKVLFLYVKEPAPDASSASLRSYSANAEKDSFFKEAVSPEAVQQWVESLLPAKKEKQ